MSIKSPVSDTAAPEQTAPPEYTLKRPNFMVRLPNGNFVPRPTPPPTMEGIPIRSRATEALVTNQIDELRANMETFYKNASLSELMFLNAALVSRDASGEHGYLTRRCLFADILLAQLGYPEPGYTKETLRFYEPE